MIHKTIVRETIIPVAKAEVVYTPPTLQRIVPERTYSNSTLFSGNGRRLLWEGLGTNVRSAGSANEVCRLAGLDYEVKTERIYTADGQPIPNMVATRRYDSNVPSTVYGVVSNRYTPVQNHIGFEFIDALFNHDGFEVETAGQFDDGKIVWVEAKLPQRNMVEEKIDPYLVFTNRHDGKGSVRIFLTPVRIICKNTLNYAIKGAQNRTFSVRHTTTAEQRLGVARETVDNYFAYLDAMEKVIEHQKRVLLTDNHLDQMINKLLPFDEEESTRVKERVMANRDELRRYYNVSDLDGVGNNGFRFINAVSDWATHRTPARQTANYVGNLFQSTLNGNEFIDAAYSMVEGMEETKSISVA